MAKQQKLFGTWSSPITPHSLGESNHINDVQWDGETLIWLETRAGKHHLLAQSGIDAPRLLLPVGTSVKGRVGYGGGAFTASSKWVVYAGDQGRLYRVPTSGGTPRPITPSFGACASPVISPDGRWVAYVFSDGVRDCLGIVDIDGKSWSKQLTTPAEADFVMQPTWSPDGKQLAYIAWNHPQMPWDGTQLILADVVYPDNGMPEIQHKQVIIGDTDTAVFQPEFSPDGNYLSYISDGSGIGQLYLYDLQTGLHEQITHEEADHSTPAWVQGLRMQGWGANKVYYLRNTQGFFSLHEYDVADKSHRIVSTSQYSSLEQISVSKQGVIALIASSSTLSPRVVTFNAEGGERIYSRTATEHLTDKDLSQAQAIEWQGHDGETVYGIYYPPTSAHSTSTGAPPLIVNIHGGPTSQKTARYEGDAQFFATRGYAVLFVNHRGSTGYGRNYMLKLRENWGIYDVEDAATGAQYLVDQGLADAKRLVIMGGSAGGFTTLQSLVDKPNFYAAGISRYGVANQFMLVQDTHKFEERYSESLLGALPDAMVTYRERSPLFYADRIRDPLLVFQGTEDTVVPKNQSDSIVEAVKARGVTVEYHVYEGEGHGFGKPDNIRDYYQKILKFLQDNVVYKA